jgi:hypothetical protein
MSIWEFELDECSEAAVPPAPAPTPAEHRQAEALDRAQAHEQAQRYAGGPLQRVAEVRHEQGVSVRRAAQLMRKPVEQIRAEEDPRADLSLSQIYEWQRLLEVPVADLLVEPHAPLSAPVLRRAQMLRLMKTVQAILEKSNQLPVRRLAQTMINQLVEIMPELEGVSPWHSFDPRNQDPNGRQLEQSYLSEPAIADDDD